MEVSEKTEFVLQVPFHISGNCRVHSEVAGEGVGGGGGWLILNYLANRNIAPIILTLFALKAANLHKCTDTDRLSNCQTEQRVTDAGLQT